jgi:hypothetical protein
MPARRRSRSGASAAIAALALGACQNASDDSEGATTPVVQLDPAFVAADCATVPMWRAPAPGTVYVGAHVGHALDVRFRTRVVSVEGSEVSRATDLFVGRAPKVEDEGADHYGFLYASDSSRLQRRFVYAPAPTAIERLWPGDRLTFAVTETLADGVRTLTAEHEFAVQLLACGTLRWAGGSTPVKVYEVRSARSGLTREGELDTGTLSTSTAYLAPSYGWPLLTTYEGGSRAEVQSIEPPT